MVGKRIERCGRWILASALLLATGRVALADEAAANGSADAAARCAQLASLALPDASVRAATAVPAGTFTPPAPADGSAAVPQQVPAFCRVQGWAPSEINFEVWLPLTGWNGKLQAVGNGGTAGVVSYPALATALNRGYAAASTDTGHVNRRPFDSTWALGHPERIEDFGHRALHVTTVHAKTIVQAYYGAPARQSYYVGCSKGGQQGLMAAQRYPDDYDGIIAGDPANDWTRFYTGAHLWYALASTRTPESYITPDKVQLLDRAVVAACDALDGIRDGVLDDPRECRFNPGTLECKAGQAPDTCMNPAQVRAVREIWQGARNAAGETIYPGLVPGAEASASGWGPWLLGTGPFTGSHWYAAEGWLRNAMFQDPARGLRDFDYDRDLAEALNRSASAVDANNPDLSRLRARGAKLIVYHGWADPDISPLAAIDYYERAVAHASPGAPRARALSSARDFYRLFMVPGMTHCSGGPGTDRFDMLGALERWVEHDEAPTQVLATHEENGAVTRSRPLCPYPQRARWNGKGSSDDARNFRCVGE